MSRLVDITRIPANVAIPLASPPASNVTRAAPGAGDAKSLFWIGTPSVFGRIPTVAAEGHEVDLFWDTRKNPPGREAFGGLSGMENPYEWRASVWGVQQRLGRSSGLGQAGDEQTLFARLDEIALDIQAGIADWRRVGNAGQAALGEHFGGTWAYALNLLTHDRNVNETSRIVASLYPGVKRWRQEAARAAGTASREVAGGAIRPTAAEFPPSGGVLQDLARVFSGAPGGEFVARWGVPLALGLFVFMFLGRR